MNREILEKPFPKELIKVRQGNFGQILDYVAVADVTQRLNDGFEGKWSYKVVLHIIRDDYDEVIVLGMLTAEGEDKMQFGGSKITRHQKTGKPLSLADDLKAAASDALKKCASQFGVALEIYGKEPLPPEPPAVNKSTEVLSKEQLASIKELRTKLGWAPETVQQKVKAIFQMDVMQLNPTMAEAFIAYLKTQDGRKLQAEAEEKPLF